MKTKNIFVFGVALVSFVFAIIFNNTTSWTLFFIVTPVLFFSIILLLKSIKITTQESSLSSSENEPIHLNIETNTTLKTLVLDGSISNKKVTSTLVKTTQSNGLNHILSFSNPLTRGVYSDSYISINVSDPFGLILKNILKKPLTPLTIYPRKRPYEANLVLEYLREHINSEHSFGLESDYSVDAISTYKPTDSIRNIHWKLSSKSEEMYVKNYNKFLKSKTTLVLHPSLSENFENALSLFYSLAIQDTYIFKEICVGESSLNLPKDIQKFASLTPFHAEITYPDHALIVTTLYLSSNRHCMQLVVGDDKCIFYGEKGLKVTSFPLSGGNIHA